MKEVLLMIFINLVNILADDQKLVSFEMRRDNLIYVYLGTPKKKLVADISQERQYTFAHPRFYSVNDSSTGKALERTSIIFTRREYQGYCVEDIIHFVEGKPFLFKFKSEANFGDHDIPNYGFIGLSFKFTDKDYSFIHKLKEHNLINHLAYSFTKKDNIGTLYFGGIPNSLVNDLQSGSCKVSLNYSTWGCQLNKVIISAFNSTDAEYTLNAPFYAAFKFSESRIFAPQEYYHYLKSSVLSVYFERKQCFESSNPVLHYISCVKEVLSLMPEVTFVFGTTALTIPLFLEDYIMIFKFTKTLDHWVFGVKFLLQFQSFFDYESQSVTFYSDKGIRHIPAVNRIDNRNNMVIKLSLQFIIGILLLNGLLLITIKAKWNYLL